MRGQGQTDQRMAPPPMLTQLQATPRNLRSLNSGDQLQQGESSVHLYQSLDAVPTSQRKANDPRSNLPFDVKATYGYQKQQSALLGARGDHLNPQSNRKKIMLNPHLQLKVKKVSDMVLPSQQPSKENLVLSPRNAADGSSSKLNMDGRRSPTYSGQQKGLVQDSSRVEIHDRSWKNLIDQMDQKEDKKLSRMLDQMRSSERISPKRGGIVNMSVHQTPILIGGNAYNLISAKDSTTEAVEMSNKMSHKPSVTDQELAMLPNFRHFEVINWEKVAYSKAKEEIKPSKLSINEPVLSMSRKQQNPFKPSSKNEPTLRNADINAVFQDKTTSVQGSNHRSASMTESLPDIYAKNEVHSHDVIVELRMPLKKRTRNQSQLQSYKDKWESSVPKQLTTLRESPRMRKKQNKLSSDGSPESIKKMVTKNQRYRSLEVGAELSSDGMTDRKEYFGCITNDYIQIRHFKEQMKVEQDLLLQDRVYRGKLRKKHNKDTTKTNNLNSKHFKRISIDQANGFSKNFPEMVKSNSIPFEQIDYDPQVLGPGKYKIDNQLTQKAAQVAKFGYHGRLEKASKESKSPFINELKNSVALKLHHSLNSSGVNNDSGGANADLSHIDTLFLINQKLENPSRNISLEIESRPLANQGSQSQLSLTSARQSQDIHQMTEKRSKANNPLSLRVPNQAKRAKNASSMFKSSVERLPEISGRHSSMTTGCPGPGDYSQANKSIDFTLKQQQIVLTGRKNTPPFIYGRRKVVKHGENPDKKKHDQLMVRDKSNRIQRQKINGPPGLIVFDTIQPEVMGSGGRSLKSIASNASLKTIESIKNMPKSKAVSPRSFLDEFDSPWRTPNDLMLHSPRQQEDVKQKVNQDLKIVDKKNQKRVHIGHMAMLAQEKSFYRNLKMNCIDHKRIQYQLRLRNQPTPGPGDYGMSQEFQNQDKASKEKKNSKTQPKTKNKVFKSVFKKDPQLRSPLDTFTNQKIKDGVIINNIGPLSKDILYMGLRDSMRDSQFKDLETQRQKAFEDSQLSESVSHVKLKGIIPADQQKQRSGRASVTLSMRDADQVNFEARSQKEEENINHNQNVESPQHGRQIEKDQVIIINPVDEHEQNSAGSHTDSNIIRYTMYRNQQLGQSATNSKDSKIKVQDNTRKQIYEKLSPSSKRLKEQETMALSRKANKIIRDIHDKQKITNAGRAAHLFGNFHTIESKAKSEESVEDEKVDENELANNQSAENEKKINYQLQKSENTIFSEKFYNPEDYQSYHNNENVPIHIGQNNLASLQMVKMNTSSQKREGDLKFMTDQQMSIFEAQKSKNTYFSTDSYQNQHQKTLQKSFVVEEEGEKFKQQNDQIDGKSRVSAASKQCIGSQRKTRSGEQSDFIYDQNFGTNMTNKETIVLADTKSAAFVPVAMKPSRESNIDSNVSFIFMNSGGIKKQEAPQMKISSPDLMKGSATYSAHHENDNISHIDAVNSNNKKADLIFNSGGNSGGNSMYPQSPNFVNTLTKQENEGPESRPGFESQARSQESQTNMNFLPQMSPREMMMINRTANFDYDGIKQSQQKLRYLPDERNSIKQRQMVMPTTSPNSTIVNERGTFSNKTRTQRERNHSQAFKGHQVPQKADPKMASGQNSEHASKTNEGDRMRYPNQTGK